MNKKEAIVTRVINVLYQGAKETWYIDGVETPKDKVVEYINPTTPKEPDTSELVFKPEDGEQYESVNSSGEIVKATWTDHYIDDERLKIGNVFRVGTAKDSAKYEIMNSEYEYWHRGLGQPKPKVLPKKLQFWVSAGWVYPHSEKVIWMDNNSLYRWKRSEQMEK